MVAQILNTPERLKSLFQKNTQARKADKKLISSVGDRT